MKLVNKIVGFIKWCFVSYIIFILYHLLFSSLLPVDENNVAQASVGYLLIGIILSIFVTYLLANRRKLKMIVSNRKPVSNKIKLDASQKVPYTKKMQEELASSLLTNIESCVELANKSDDVSLFVNWYDEAVNDITMLTKLNKVKFQGSPALDLYRFNDEFQWHLCDAIVRAKEKTLIDIKLKYRNSHEFQIRAANSFENDIESVRNRFSEDAKALADRSIKEIKSAVGIRTQPQTFDDVPSYENNFERHNCTNAILLTVDLMEGIEFEHWCANLLTDMGYSNVSVTQSSGDQGVDVLAEKDGIKYAIQCKCYSKDLGNTPVQEILAGKHFYHCHVGAVMTNQYFTKGAKDLATETGVLLWDRDWIEAALNMYRPISVSPGYESYPIDVEDESTLLDSDDDKMIAEAMDLVMEVGQVSVSMLQRRMKIGYARAAMIVDKMEKKGYIGAFNGNQPRAILITQQRWNTIKRQNNK